MNQGWQIKLLLFVLAVGVPAMRAVLQALGRQREQAKAEAMRQKRLEDALRTGHGAEAESASEVDPAAARRQAQLEELRRRARSRASQAGVPGAASGRPPTAPGPVVSAPPQARGNRQLGREPQPARSPARAPAPPPLRPASRPVPPQRPAPGAARQGQRTAAAPARRQAQPQPARPAKPPPREEAPVVRRLVAEAPPTPPPVLSRHETEAVLDFQTASLADWRRAIVMREVLDPPLALRPPADGMGPAFGA